MKLMGILFVVIACGSAGFRIAASLKQKCALYELILRQLAMMKQEICFHATPLAQVFALLAASCGGTLAQIWEETAKQMDNHPWTPPQYAMDLALKGAKEPLLEPILLPLCTQLGKYDVDAQRKAIEAAEEQTASLLHEMQQERSVKSKTYQTMGICAGLAAAVLLI